MDSGSYADLHTNDIIGELIGSARYQEKYEVRVGIKDEPKYYYVFRLYDK